jgi:hypothetical protein
VVEMNQHTSKINLLTMIEFEPNISITVSAQALRQA